MVNSYIDGSLLSHVTMIIVVKHSNLYIFDH